MKIDIASSFDVEARGDRLMTRAQLHPLTVQNILTKSLGTQNPHNVVRATFTGLVELKDPVVLARLRGVDVEELTA